MWIMEGFHWIEKLEGRLEVWISRIWCQDTGLRLKAGNLWLGVCHGVTEQDLYRDVWYGSIRCTCTFRDTPWFGDQLSLFPQLCIYQ